MCKAAFFILKTSGERNAKIVIRIVRPVPVDVDTIGLEVPDIDQVAIGITAFLCTFPAMHQRCSLPSLRLTTKDSRLYKYAPLICYLCYFRSHL